MVGIESRFLGAAFPVIIVWHARTIGMTRHGLHEPFNQVGEEELPYRAMDDVEGFACLLLQFVQIVTRRQQGTIDKVEGFAFDAVDLKRSYHCGSDV